MIVLSVVALAAEVANADNWTMSITVDNAYNVYFGDQFLTTPTFVGGDPNWPTTETWNISGVNPTDFLYVATASDHSVAQGFLGSFTNTTTSNTFVTSDAPTPWEVFPAGAYLPQLNAIDPSIPAAVWPAGVQPTTSQVQTAVTYATQNNLWVPPTSAPSYNNSPTTLPWGMRPSIPSTAEWIWYDKGNSPSGSYPSPLNGWNHDEFLVFRVPGVPVPEPSSFVLATCGVIAAGLLAWKRRGRLPAMMLMAAATVSGAANVLHAGTIANLTVANLSGAPTFNDGLFSGIKRETQSSVSVLSSNLTAMMPNFSARLAGIATMDVETPNPTQSAIIPLWMQINFDVVALPTEAWSIDVAQTRNFAMTLAPDPPTDGFQSQALVDQHLANYSITPGPSGNLQFPSAGTEDTGATFGNVDVPVNQTTLDTLTGVGPASITMNFQQRLVAHSFANADPLITVRAPGQEASVRFGIPGSLSNVTADDYPGPGGRVFANDGHFVRVKATFVPEPGAICLVIFGTAAMVCRRATR